MRRFRKLSHPRNVKQLCGANTVQKQKWGQILKNNMQRNFILILWAMGAIEGFKMIRQRIDFLSFFLCAVFPSYQEVLREKNMLKSRTPLIFAQIFFSFYSIIRTHNGLVMGKHTLHMLHPIGVSILTKKMTYIVNTKLYQSLKKNLFSSF